MVPDDATNEVAESGQPDHHGQEAVSRTISPVAEAGLQHLLGQYEDIARRAAGLTRIKFVSIGVAALFWLAYMIPGAILVTLIYGDPDKAPEWVSGVLGFATLIPTVATGIYLHKRRLRKAHDALDDLKRQLSQDISSYATKHADVVAHWFDGLSGLERPEKIRAALAVVRHGAAPSVQTPAGSAVLADGTAPSAQTPAPLAAQAQCVTGTAMWGCLSLGLLATPSHVWVVGSPLRTRTLVIMVALCFSPIAIVPLLLLASLLLQWFVFGGRSAWVALRNKDLEALERMRKKCRIYDRDDIEMVSFDETTLKLRIEGKVQKGRRLRLTLAARAEDAASFKNFVNELRS